MRLEQGIERLYDSVARQHGLFVKILPSPLAEYSIDAYLLYRIIDTVEDSALAFEMKTALLDEMSKDLLPGIETAAARLRNCAEIAPAYRELLEAANSILEFHSSLDENARSSIERTGRTMASGMLRFIRQFHDAQESGRRNFLADIDELDQYCYFVAGCVGELHTEFFIARKLLRGNPEQFLKQGSELGKYLQIVNIIRDRRDDMTSRNKTYIPNSLHHLPDGEQIAELIRFARSKEPLIEKYLASFAGCSAKIYCRTLYHVAKVHFDFYARATSHELKKPPAAKLFAALPLKLKLHFIAYKIKKIISVT